MAEVAGEGAGLQLTAGRHAKFLQRTLHVLPSSHANFDTQRVTISYFAIAGLDLLDKLELVAEQRREVVEWLHLCLVSPAPGKEGEGRRERVPGRPKHFVRASQEKSGGGTRKLCISQKDKAEIRREYC